MPLRAKTALVGRLLGRSAGDYRLFELDSDCVRAVGAGQDRVIPLVSVLDVTAIRSFLFSDITLSLADRQVTVCGVSSRSAGRFCAALRDRVLSEQRMAIQGLWPVVLDLHNRITALSQGQRFIRRGEVKGLLEKAEGAEPLRALARSTVRDRLVAEEDALVWEEVARFLSHPERTRKEWNEPLVLAELDTWRGFLDSCVTDPETGELIELSDEQRRAVLSDEDTTLVVAAAGSGKTTVIAARVAWLLKVRQDELACNGDKVLVTCFPKVVAKELQTRLGKAIGKCVVVKHLHSLGCEVIGEVEGRKPRVSPIAEDRIELLRWIKDIVKEEGRESTVALEMASWASYRESARSMFDFPDQLSYEQHVRNVEPRTLKAERVKSVEECEIANFLYLNGIAYEYEPLYPGPASAPGRRPYLPDFLLTEYEIYIEHFAIDENGRTPPFIPQKKYLADMRWKRNLHKKHGTTLVETYSYQRRNGTLFQELAGKLLAHGVRLSPGEIEDPLKTLRELGEVDRLTELLTRFLQHVMSNRYDMGTLQRRAAEMPDSVRAQSFLRLFERILQRYKAYLHEKGEIDFYEMIDRAAGYVRNGSYQSAYRHVIVDEFQDISTSLANLVTALVDQRKPDSRLFCVGDDWQAIFRFAGADPFVMQRMDEQEGHLELNKTHRFNSAIAQVSSEFVLKNPRQIRKRVQPASAVTEPRVFVVWGESGGTRPVYEALSAIASDSRAGGTVFLLGRYNQNLLVNKVPYLDGELKRLKEYVRQFGSLSILRDPKRNTWIRTVHDVKGLQADYVIVVGLSGERYGFPTGIEDDPILEIAMARGDLFPHAEERRLFYVALTRAKTAVFLINDAGHPSPFVSEVERDDTLRGTRHVKRIGSERCPRCGRGVLVLKRGTYGEFWACSSYPACKGPGRTIGRGFPLL